MRKTLEELRTEISEAFTKSDIAALRALLPVVEQADEPQLAADALRIKAKITRDDGAREEAIALYNRAISIYTEHDDEVSAALTENDIGVLYLHTGEYQLAAACFERTIEQLRKLETDKSTLTPLHNLALCYRSMHQYDRATELYRQCLEEAEADNNQSVAGMVHIGLGGLHETMSDFAPALEHYHRAQDIAQTISSEKILFYAHVGLGIVYDEVGDFPSALRHLHIALDTAERSGVKRRIAKAYCNIGLLYQDLKDLDQAETWIRRALDIYIQTGDRYGTAAMLDNIASIYHHRKDTDAAIDHFQQALDLYQDLGMNDDVVAALQNMTATLFAADRFEEGRPYMDQAENLVIQTPTSMFQRKQLRAAWYKYKGDLDSATTLLHDCIALAEGHNMISFVASAHENLREIALVNNDLAAYVRHNDRYTQIHTDLSGVATAQKIAAQETERKLAAERQEREKERAVLYSTLPKHIADRIVRGEQVTGDHYDNAAVIFVDIVGFTSISDQLSASDVVNFLERLFSQFDEICKRHGVTKIKTIGDSYMAVAFTEQPNNRITEQPNTAEQPSTSDPSHRAANAAFDIMRAVADFELPAVPLSTRNDSPTPSFRSPEGSPERSPEGSHVRVRIGIHAGTLTAGVIGTERLQYDVWGDTVNVASRLESTGEPGMIHVSETFAQSLRQQELRQHDQRQGNVEPGTWHVALRGNIELKGKGTMTTYWLESDG